MTRTSTKGFTLIEAIIVIALVAVILAVVSSTLVVMVKSFSNIGRTRVLTSSASIALERLAREVRNAKNVNVGSVLGVNPSTLVLDTTTEAGVDTTVNFSVISGTLVFQQAGVTASLTPSYLTVENFLVRQLITPVSKAVRVDLSVSDERGEKLEILLHDTIILRDSY
jgi:prepilin-type N-terminal cleavage/methylation domain-containing protein